MPSPGELWRRLQFWVHRDQFSADLDEEMRLHTDLRAEQLRASEHLTDEGAVLAARRRFGNATQLKEISRELWSGRWAEDFVQDVRFALRQLRKAPSFTAVAVLSLALGIGANTAIFTLVNAVLLKSLPIRDPAGLLLLGDARGEGVGTAQARSFWVYSVDLYRHLDALDLFDGLAAVQSGDQTRVSVRRANWTEAQPARATLVSGNYFSVLGVPAALGRTFAPSDDSASAPPVAVISFEYWKRVFGDNPAAIGSTLDVSGVAVTVIGVAPPGFFGEKLRADPPGIWLPIAVQPLLDPQRNLVNSPDAHWLYLIGRLKPNVSIARAQVRLTAALRNWRFAREGSAISDEDRQQILANYIELTPAGGGVAGMKREYGHSLEILFAITLTVLIVACANIAALLLARGSSRRGERLLRLALGGGRGRLMRQSLAESLTLGLLGGGLALVIAGVGTKLLVAAAFRGADFVPIQVAPDLRVLAFTLALSVVAVVLFGVLPTLHIGTEIAHGMKGATAPDEWSGHRRARLGLGAALIIGEAALSVVVLTCAGAFVRSLENLAQQQFGFDRAHVLTINVDPERAGYDHQQLAPLYREMEQRLNALPGVTSASFSTYSPLNECCTSFSIAIDGYIHKPDEEPHARIDRASTRYFQTIGTQLIRGRTFDARDTPNAPPVAVVSEAFVRRYFSHDDPIGKRFGFGGGADKARDLEIVGVVEDAKYNDIREDPFPTAFLPLLQAPHNPIGVLTETDFADVIEIRAIGRPDALASEVRSALTGIDPKLSVMHVATVADHLSNALSQDDVVAALATFFGLLALVLTSVGLYGLTAFGVSRRASEIGLRMALGARRGVVTGMVLERVLVQGAIGVLLGIPIAFIASRVIASQLYGVSPTDPRNSALAAAGLILCITIAGLIPARRAARIDPIVALRAE